MRTILVLNAKGGCGKSTIATNLASYFAHEMGKKVVLADYDPQESSLAWLEARDEKWPHIEGVAAHKEPLRVAKDTDFIIMDGYTEHCYSFIHNILKNIMDRYYYLDEKIQGERSLIKIYKLHNEDNNLHL